LLNVHHHNNGLKYILLYSSALLSNLIAICHMWRQAI
jgi:hypothetical protein